MERMLCRFCGAQVYTYEQDGVLLVATHRVGDDRYPLWCDEGSEIPA